MIIEVVYIQFYPFQSDVLSLTDNVNENYKSKNLTYICLSYLEHHKPRISTTMLQ